MQMLIEAVTFFKEDFHLHKKLLEKLTDFGKRLELICAPT